VFQIYLFLTEIDFLFLLFLNSSLSYNIFESRFKWSLSARTVVHEEGESLPYTRRSRPSLNDGPSLCAARLSCWWCWRALPAAINTSVKSLYCVDHHPIRIGDERERLVTASPVMTKSRAPTGGNNYPENGLVKPPRRDARALGPAGMFGGKAPLRLAA
jgi:hypothetical protein